MSETQNTAIDLGSLLKGLPSNGPFPEPEILIIVAVSAMHEENSNCTIQTVNKASVFFILTKALSF